jgi:predicted transcriptional regulator
MEHGSGAMKRPVRGIAHALGGLEPRVMEHLWTHDPDSAANGQRALVKKRLVAESGIHLETRYVAVRDRAAFVEQVVADVVGDLLGEHQTATIHGFFEAIADNEAALQQTPYLIKERRRRRP